MIAMPCCSHHCLSALGVNDATEVVVGALKEYVNLNAVEKRLLISEKIRSCAKGLSPQGNLRVNYSVGSLLGGKVSGICHTSFENVYGVSHKYVDNVRIEVKRGISGNVHNEPFTDRSSYRRSTDFVNGLIKLSAKRGRPLTSQLIAAMLIPNSPVCLSAYAWMDAFFDMMGDKIPNSNGEVHLEPIDVTEIYKEYVRDKEKVDAYIQSSQFYSLFRYCNIQLHI